MKSTSTTFVLTFVCFSLEVTSQLSPLLTSPQASDIEAKQLKMKNGKQNCCQVVGAKKEYI